MTLVVVCQGPACLRRGASTALAIVRNDLTARALVKPERVCASGCRGRCHEGIAAAVLPARAEVRVPSDRQARQLADELAEVLLTQRAGIQPSRRPALPVQVRGGVFRRWRY
jgi:hypothetical protein